MYVVVIITYFLRTGACLVCVHLCRIIISVYEIRDDGKPLVITKSEADILFSGLSGPYLPTSAYLYMGRARKTEPFKTYREETKTRVQLVRQSNGDIHIEPTSPAECAGMWHAAWGLAVERDGDGEVVDIHIVHARYKHKEDMPLGMVIGADPAR